MKIIYLTQVIIVTHCIVGCTTIKYSFDLKIEERVLYSPSGKHKFHLQKRPPYGYLASDGIYTVILKPLENFELIKNSQKLRTKSTNKFKIFIDSANTYFQVNRTNKHALNLIPHIYSNPKSEYHQNLFEIVVPDIITRAKSKYHSIDGNLGVYVDNNKWRRLTSEERSSMSNDIYHYRIVFFLEEEKYIIDFEFRFDYKTKFETTIFPGAGVLP